MPLDRRSFLKGSCITAGAFAAGPKWLAAGMFNRPLSAPSDSNLVVVQLAGGNDGLNTVVPTAGAAASAYRAARPRVRLNPAQTLRLDSQNGLHPSLTNLHRYFTQGQLAIVRGVGNAKADLSHFNEIERWHRADLDIRSTEGWLGKTLDFLYPTDTGAIRAVAIAGDLTPALESRAVTPTVLVDAEEFGFLSDDPNALQAFRTSLLPIGARDHDFVSKTATDALNHSRLIRNAVAAYQPAVTYPTGDFGNGLKLIAAVMAANLGPRIFYITQDVDYDQHDSLLGTHGANLRALDRGLDAFQRDVQAHGLGNRVVTFIWTEFGRRVEDNASAGTDHGSAGLAFLLGNRVRGGFFGDAPSLTDLDDSGSLKPSMDFRRVYSSILANWMDADPVAILGENFPTLPIL